MYSCIATPNYWLIFIVQSSLKIKLIRHVKCNLRSWPAISKNKTTFFTDRGLRLKSQTAVCGFHFSLSVFIRQYFLKIILIKIIAW